MLSLDSLLKDKRIEQEVSCLSNVDLENYMWSWEDSEELAEEDYFWLQDHIGAESYAYGVSKLVLFSKNKDIVYKIPFQGCKSMVYDEDDEETEEYDITLYDGANNEFLNEEENPRSWDYCSIESQLYDEAVEFGINQMFAETRPLTTVNGYPIYVAERCKKNKSLREKDFPENSIIQSKKLLKNIYTSLPIVYLAQFIKDWGYDKSLEMLNFIKTYSVHDLHSGNIGLNKDNKVVLIDYSDYNS